MQAEFFLFRQYRLHYQGPLPLEAAIAFMEEHKNDKHNLEVAGNLSPWVRLDDEITLCKFYPQLVKEKFQFLEEEETKHNISISQVKNEQLLPTPPIQNSAKRKKFLLLLFILLLASAVILIAVL
jgi:hypothetical protein